MKKLILGFVLISLITSCATHHGTISSSVLDKNYVYQESAIGISKTTHILGIGGLSKDALIYEAKTKLHKNYPLEPSESYLNYTLDFKRSFYLLFSQTKVTLTADIIEIVGDSTVYPFSDKYLTSIGKTDGLENELFQVGDSVYFDRKKEGIIVSFPKPDQAKVQFTNLQGNLKTKNISISELFSRGEKMHGYEIGDHYVFETEINDVKTTKVGKVVGIGLESLLIESQETNIIKTVRIK